MAAGRLIGIRQRPSPAGGEGLEGMKPVLPSPLKWSKKCLCSSEVLHSFSVSGEMACSIQINCKARLTDGSDMYCKN